MSEVFDIPAHDHQAGTIHLQTTGENEQPQTYMATLVDPDGLVIARTIGYSAKDSVRNLINYSEWGKT